MNDPVSAPVGLIAGGGAYPQVLLGALEVAGHRVVIASVWRQTRRLESGVIAAQREFPPGSLGEVARFFADNGVSLAYMAGAVDRRLLPPLAFADRHTARLLPRILFGGDDGLLRGVAEAFDRMGIVIADPSRYLHGSFAGEGHLAGPFPDDDLVAQIEFATAAARDCGRRDRGQSAVFFRGRLAGLEGREGTNALLSSAPGPGAVLAKVVKPGQDRRFDLPAIGPSTAMLGAMVGLSAIGVEAGGVLLLERERLEKACDRNGISLWGLTPPRVPGAGS